MKKVYLLTYGDGDDGNEWGVISIHSTRELAEKAQKEYEPAVNIYGKPYTRQSEIEEWPVDSQQLQGNVPELLPDYDTEIVGTWSALSYNPDVDAITAINKPGTCEL